MITDADAAAIRTATAELQALMERVTAKILERDNRSKSLLDSLMDPDPTHMPLQGNLWWASVSKDRYAYHRDGGTRWYIRRNEFVPGEWLEIEGDLEFCSNGIHVSRTVVDRWAYASEEYLALVEVDSGDDYETRDDRSVYRRARFLRIWEKSQFWDAVRTEFAAAGQDYHQDRLYNPPGVCVYDECLDCLRHAARLHPDILTRVERRLLAMPPVVSVPF